VKVAFDEQAKWLVLRRGDIEIVCNLAPERQAIPVGGKPHGILASDDAFDLRPDSIELAADSVAILSPQVLVSMQEHVGQYAAA
jgi:maltooligosyltrehalose trehalohydrolase